MAGREFYTEIIQTFLMVLAVLTVVWIYWVKIQKNNYRSLGFQRSQWLFKELAFGLVTGVLLIVGTFLISISFHQIEIKAIHFDIASFLKYLLIFLLVGFYEELLTRGYFLGTFIKLTNKYIALIITALIFSLMHIVNSNFSLVPFFNIILAGILLGVVYIHTQRLWFAIALHFVWNFLQGPILGSQVSGNITSSVLQIKITGGILLTGGNFGFEGSLIMSVFMILFIGGLEIYYRKNPGFEKS